MPREVQDIHVDEKGRETHPAFGMVHVTRPSSNPGAVLFDSDIRHQHYIRLVIERADRQRDLSRDWIHGSRELIEINMSESQWAQLVSSIGSSGTPCTIGYFASRGLEEGMQPGLPFRSSLDITAQEASDVAYRTYEKVREAFKAVEEKPTKANIRALGFAIRGVENNVKFVAESMTEHTENVVTKAKADIEAMIDARAREVGIDPILAAQSMPMLEAGDE